MSATVTDADRQAAISFRQSGFAGWMDGVQTEAWLVEKLAQFAADARRSEALACKGVVVGMMCETINCSHYDCGLLNKAASAIAARGFR